MHDQPAAPLYFHFDVVTPYPRPTALHTLSTVAPNLSTGARIDLAQTTMFQVVVERMRGISNDTTQCMDSIALIRSLAIDEASRTVGVDPLVAYAQCGTVDTRAVAADVLCACVRGIGSLVLHATKQGAVKCAGWLL